MTFRAREPGARRSESRAREPRHARRFHRLVQAYRAWVFERVGNHRGLFDLDLAELTPAAFKLPQG